MSPIVREKQKIRVQTFNGGEDSTSEPSVIKTPAASIARNVNLNSLGKAVQRIGLARVGDNPDELIAHYTFDASDSTDDKGALDGTDTSVSYVDGKFGIAASFNGTTSLITIAADTTIDCDEMEDFVISCWVYVKSDGQNDKGVIFDKVGATTAGYRAWVHTESSSTVELSFEVQHADTDAVVETSTTIATDTWTKLEFHSNADDSLDIYINGAVASYDTDTSGVGAKSDDSANALIIGNRAAADRTFDGYIDDLRIYDGTRAADKYEMDKIYGLTHYKVGSTIDRVYRIRDKDLENLDDDGKGWTTVDAGFTADKQTNFVQAKDILFILNGTEDVHTMASDETVTDEGNFTNDNADDPPKTPSYGAWAQNNRMFLSGSTVAGQEDWVWFSNSLDPQTYDQTNVFKVRSGSGGKVTWLQTFKLNELMIYKEDSIFVLDMSGATPLTDWKLQPVNIDIGCKAGQTVQDIGNDHVFLDHEARVRLLSRTTFDKLRTSVISGPIQDILDDINMDEIAQATSAFIDGKYYLSFPSDTSTINNRTVVWDAEAARLTGNPASGWSVMPADTWNVSAYTTFQFGDNTNRLVVGDSRALSLVYKQSGNTDNGTTIDMEVAGPTHDGGNRHTDKIWGPLFVVWNAGENTTAELFADVEESGFVSLGTLGLTGSSPILPIPLPFSLGGKNKATDMFQIKNLGRGKTCRIKAKHQQYNQTATFIEYELYSEERIPRP